MKSLKDKIELLGLVLCGGKSTRMGEDKSIIEYHGMPQRNYVYKLLSKVCSRTYFSIREDQLSEIPDHALYIIDKNEYKGPYNGLLSAHAAHPEAAWLVLACDLPLMDAVSLQSLVAARNNEVATAFATSESGLPEPLAAIWEPEGLARSVEFLTSGRVTCPRKFLIGQSPELVYPENDSILMNANSKEDYNEVFLRIEAT